MALSMFRKVLQTCVSVLNGLFCFGVSLFLILCIFLRFVSIIFSSVVGMPFALHVRIYFFHGA